jgi:transposase-like protein
MPAAKAPEFRRRAVELARRGEQPVAQIAKDLGISESCLRRWMAIDDVDAGRRDGLSSDERRELVELRRRTRVLERETRSSSGQRLLRAGERAPKIGFRDGPGDGRRGVDVAVICRVLGVSRSGYYQWRGRGPSQRDLGDAYLANEIRDIPRLRARPTVRRASASSCGSDAGCGSAASASPA